VLGAQSGHPSSLSLCQTRSVRGVEDFQEITIWHSKYAASRFVHQAAQARVLEGVDGADSRDCLGRGRPPARERVRIRAGHHSGRPVDAAAGHAVGDAGKGEGAVGVEIGCINERTTPHAL